VVSVKDEEQVASASKAAEDLNKIILSRKHTPGGTENETLKNSNDFIRVDQDQNYKINPPNSSVYVSPDSYNALNS
jgi:hypothetical protein